MRETKFRGRKTDNGEWVYGYCVNSVNDRTYIISYATEDTINTLNEIDFLYNEVIPESVGQYIGIKDKNGVEIYEGDICENGDWENDAHDYNYRIEEVKYIEDEACFIGYNFIVDGMTCKVIGNKFDNPELLEVK